MKWHKLIVSRQSENRHRRWNRGGGGGGGGGAGGAIAPHFLQEEVDRFTPSTGLIRDVPGGSALRS